MEHLRASSRDGSLASEILGHEPRRRDRLVVRRRDHGQRSMLVNGLDFIGDMKTNSKGFVLKAVAPATGRPAGRAAGIEVFAPTLRRDCRLADPQSTSPTISTIFAEVAVALSTDSCHSYHGVDGRRRTSRACALQASAKCLDDGASGFACQTLRVRVAKQHLVESRPMTEKARFLSHPSAVFVKELPLTALYLVVD